MLLFKIDLFNINISYYLIKLKIYYKLLNNKSEMITFKNE